MRIECGDNGRNATHPGGIHRRADHRLMTKMEAVEIAQRDNRTAQGIGGRLAGEEALHAEGADKARWPDVKGKTLG
jgi:hypothetical protein